MQSLLNQIPAGTSAPWSAGISTSVNFEAVSVNAMPGRIPARIIQTGRSGDIPLLHRAAVSNILALNPDFEYRFFDDRAVEEFVTEEYPQYRKVFDGFSFRIQKYDFFRYLAVHRYGGFYLDLDVLLASSLGPLRDCSCIFSFESLTVSRFLRKRLGMDWQLGNYAFGAIAGHPFIEAVIESCVRAQEDPEWVKPMKKGYAPFRADESQILNSTGPGVVSRTYAENTTLAKTVSVLFPEDVSDRRNWNRFGEYGIHLMDSSWRVPKDYARHKLADFYGRWIQHRNVERARRLGNRRACHGPMHSLSGF